MTYLPLTPKIAGALLIVQLSACSDASVAPANDPDLRTILPISPVSSQSGVASAIPGPSVRLVDGNGQPISGVVLRFEVRTGGGSVANEVMTTQGDGFASGGSWTLGTNSTMNSLRVSGDRIAPLDFFAFANPGPPAELRLLSGDRQAGLVNGRVYAPSVRLADRYSNPIAGVLVHFQGARGSEPDVIVSVPSNVHGLASPVSWELGPLPGTYSITVRAVDLSPLVVQAFAIDQSSIIATYDLVTVDGRAPSLWNILAGTVSLSSTGHFLDATHYRNGYTIETSGKYTLADSNVTLDHSTGHQELGTLNSTSLKLSRADYYSLPVSWAYTRRK